MSHSSRSNVEVVYRAGYSSYLHMHRLGMLNSWGRGIHHVTTEKIYCYITDNILARERWVGAHFGDFISC